MTRTLRRSLSLTLAALSAATLVGCGNALSPTAPAASSTVALQSKKADPGLTDTTGYERLVLRELADRYPGQSITLEDMYATSGGQYRFTASVQGRRVTGTLNSYTGDVRIDGNGPTPGGNEIQAKQAILRELTYQFPRAAIYDLTVTSNYGGTAAFRANVDNRIVTGSYDSYSGRVTINGGNNPYPPSGNVEQGILSQLARRFPGQSITLENASYDSYNRNYRWTASIQGRYQAGHYWPETGRMTLD